MLNVPWPCYRRVAVWPSWCTAVYTVCRTLSLDPLKDNVCLWDKAMQALLNRISFI